MSYITAFAGSVPANYDKYLGPVLFEPYAIDLVKRIEKKSLRDVLELACGTGRVTKHLASLVPSDGSLIASDLNEDMLSVARKILPSLDVTWMVVDAQELPFSENSFDHIICQFGVMFFPDKEKAFAEAYRVLKADGRLLFNVWDSMEHNPRSAIVKNIVEGIMGDDAPDFMSKGPYSYNEKDVISQSLKDAGFNNIDIDVVQITTYYPSADNLINGFVHGSPLSGYLAQLQPLLQQEIKDRLKQKITAEFGEAQIVSPMQALVVSANK